MLGVVADRAGRQALGLGQHVGERSAGTDGLGVRPPEIFSPAGRIHGIAIFNFVAGFHRSALVGGGGGGLVAGGGLPPLTAGITVVNQGDQQGQAHQVRRLTPADVQPG